MKNKFMLHHSMYDHITAHPFFFLKKIHDEQFTALAISIDKKIEQQCVLFDEDSVVETNLDTFGFNTTIPIAYVHKKVNVAEKLQKLMSVSAAFLFSPSFTIKEIKELLQSGPGNSYPMMQLKNRCLNLKENYWLIEEPIRVQQYPTYRTKSDARYALFPTDTKNKVVWFPLETIPPHIKIEDGIDQAVKFNQALGTTMIITSNLPFRPIWGKNVYSMCFSLFQTWESYCNALAIVLGCTDYFYTANRIHYYETLCYYDGRTITNGSEYFTHDGNKDGDYAKRVEEGKHLWMGGPPPANF